MNITTLVTIRHEDARMSDMSLQRIGQVALTVRDLPRAVAFYRDTLGLKFLFEVPNMAFFDCGGVRLLLGTDAVAGPTPPQSMLYYVVGDIQGAHERITAKGAATIAAPRMIAKMPDHDLWLAEMRDSEGNPFALMCEKRG